MAGGFNPRAYRPKAEKRKRKFPKVFLWTWGLLGVIGLLGAGGLEWYYSHTLKRVSQLQEETQKLTQEIEALKKDPRRYEEIARKKYGYVKDNERLILFKEGK